jgi:hypothetical protein
VNVTDSFCLFGFVKPVVVHVTELDAWAAALVSTPAFESLIVEPSGNPEVPKYWTSSHTSSFFSAVTLS